MMLGVTLPLEHNIPLMYIAGVIAATILEYVTGYVMERLFKVKYWDYSYQKFNLNGYICLSSSIAWGFLTIFLTEVIHKPIEHVVLSMNQHMLIAVLAVVSALFLFDSIESAKAAFNLGRALEAMSKMRAELEDIQVQLALMKAEAEEKVSSMRVEAEERLASAKVEAAQRLADMMEGTGQKLAGARDGAGQLVGGAKENAGQLIGGAKESAGQLVGGAKAGAGQLVDGVKNGTGQVFGSIGGAKEGAAQRLADMIGNLELRMEEIRMERRERPDYIALRERIRAIKERRPTFSKLTAYYYRSLLEGNPHATSRFSNALSEMRETMSKKKDTYSDTK